MNPSTFPWISTSTLLLLGIFSSATFPLTQGHFCEFTDSDHHLQKSTTTTARGNSAESGSSSDQESAFGKYGNGTSAAMVCGEESQFCYALWRVRGPAAAGNFRNLSFAGDESPGQVDVEQVQFIKQGCWEASQASRRSACSFSNCTSYFGDLGDGGFDSSQLFFCCCSGDFCNQNVFLRKEQPRDVTDYDQFSPQQPKTSGKTAAAAWKVWLLVFSVTAALFALALLSKGKFLQLRGGKGGTGQDPEQQQLNCLSEPELLRQSQFEASKVDPELVKPGREIACGRFGRILELLSSPDLVLKVYPAATPSSVSSLGTSTSLLSTATTSTQVTSLTATQQPGNQSAFFENERLIYEILREQRGSHFLRYAGHCEILSCPALLLQRAKFSLREFLQMDRKLSRAAALKLMVGVARGLGQLHNLNCRSGAPRAVVHRDLTSRNVLTDGAEGVWLADFGLSLVVDGPSYLWAGRERQAEFCSLVDAGTLRYMAPELLEGCVNLKDCENALKQADVYSLSLVLWEIAHACHDLRITTTTARGKNAKNNKTSLKNSSREMDVQETPQADTEFCNEPKSLHALPFEEEIAAKFKDSRSVVMTPELLRQLVVGRRLRPRFHSFSHSGLSLALRETLAESWDSEPEARLTSLCVLERLSEMQGLSESSARYCKTSAHPVRLEPPPTEQEDSPLLLSPGGNWVDRNKCIERNLLTAAGKSEQTHGNSSGGGAEKNGAESSAGTLSTNLSSGSGSASGAREFQNRVAGNNAPRRQIQTIRNDFG